jgi:hypothetical protein
MFLVTTDSLCLEVASMSLPTPYIGHLTEEDYEHVYEPAGERGQRRPSLIGPEDSFILLDALEADTIPLRAARPSLCVEIGCDGSSMLRCRIDVPHAAARTKSEP